MLQAGVSRHLHSVDTVQLQGRADSRLNIIRDRRALTRPNLGRVVGEEGEGGAGAGGEDLVLVSPGETLSSPLSSLTVSHRLAQSHELLAHPDVLDVREGVVAFSRQDERDRI